MSSDAAPAAQRLSAIGGFRLVTADLPRLAGFYRDVLGFVPDGPERVISGAEMTLLGLRGTGRRRGFRLGEQIVAIDQFDAPGRPYPAGGNAAALAFQHLALVTADMGAAYQRVRGAGAAEISRDGPQLLPVSSGGVQAYKFRDPDGHPLELLCFPSDRTPPAWRGRVADAAQIGLGIDHSAISVADADASTECYVSLGLAPGERTDNRGPKQQRLDGIEDVMVTVAPMLPAEATPHLELLIYHVPRGLAGPIAQANDVAATRIVWRGTCAALLRDPDGHLHQVDAPAVSA